MPFRLSERCEWIHNWDAIAEGLPLAGTITSSGLLKVHTLGARRYQMVAIAMQCREGLTLHTVLISDFRMRRIDERLGPERVAFELHSWVGTICLKPRSNAQEGNARRAQGDVLQEVPSAVPAGGGQVASAAVLERILSDVVSRLNRLATQRFYCQVERRYHPYSEETNGKVIADAVGTVGSLARMDGEARRVVAASMDAILGSLASTPSVKGMCR